MAGKHDKVKDKDRFSILYPYVDRCCICGSTNGVAIHEVFYGPYRAKSKEHGLVVPLCGNHHNMSDAGVHFNKALDKKFKKMAQLKWMKLNGPEEEFIKIFGKSYLHDDEDVV